MSYGLTQGAEMSRNREVCSFCKGSVISGIHLPSDFSDREPCRDGKVFVAKCDECDKYSSDVDAAKVVSELTKWPVLRSLDSEDSTDRKRREDAKVNALMHRPYFNVTIAEAEAIHARRKDWDSYFMDIAKQVATRATCPRKNVGAVIVREKMILSTGYNGSVAGGDHCTEVGCMMEDGHCVRTVHSEANAIIQAAKNGVRIDGAGIYVTASPCWFCFKLIANSGLKRIVFGEMYRDEKITEYARRADIELVNMGARRP
jgi:dCMP deaminase